MILETVTLENLSISDYRKCHSLNARDRGEMQRNLKRCYMQKIPGTIVMAKEGDLLLGWGFAFKLWAHDGTKRVGFKRIPDAHFYVRKAYRGQGIGRQIMQELTVHHNKIRVYPYDLKSSIFFAEYRKNIVTGRYNAWRIREAQSIRAKSS